MTEPRQITIADWFAIVVGIALCWTLPSGNPAYPHPAFGYILLAQRLFACVTMSAGLVVIARQFRYRREVKPAEWFVMLMTAAFLAGLIPNVDTALDTFHRHRFGSPLDFRWTEWRWGLAVTVAAAASVVVLLQRLLRLPAYLRTIVITTLAVAVLWGPLSVFRMHLELPRSSPITIPLGLADAVFLETRTAIRQLPEGLLFISAAMTALLASRDQRRQWQWTCWTSAVLAFLSLLCVVPVVVWWIVNGNGNERIAKLLVGAPWLLAIAAVSYIFARYFCARFSESVHHSQGFTERPQT